MHCLFAFLLAITLLTTRVGGFQQVLPHGLIRPSLVKRDNQSKLCSLQRFVDNIVKSDKKQTVFVGGKGGVGKTTTSSALAIQLALQDLKVLVVSTDPAHSLGDALDEDLRRGRGKPVMMTDPLTSGRLFAAEVDAESALQEFRENLASFDVENLASSLGVSPDILESLGLSEFSGLLNNPPPGLDELVALANVMDAEKDDFDVIVVDTAPTGHTLRLLALPQFLDGLLGKLIKLRMKLGGLTSTLQAFLGDTGAQQRAETMDNAMEKLEDFKVKMSNVEDKLKDNSMTSFLVVTIPTTLAVKESQRLVLELRRQGIAVSDIVVNQCVGKIGDGASEALTDYYNRRQDGQMKWISKLKDAIDDVSSSDEFKSNGDANPITLTQLPFIDVELVGVAALGFVGNQYFANNPNFQYLMEPTNGEPRVVICGGKGGVGKTTTSSSLAVAMSAKGQKVALISTDPAHSLGDAIDINLDGGNLIDCPLIGVASNGEGSLSVMEIDPSTALEEFKSIVQQLLGGGGSSTNTGGSDMRNTLQEIENIFDTLPVGTDEVVALAKVVSLIKKGDFDSIVLDTAPTGHTLRMLTTPGFLADLIDRLLTIARKVNSNAAIKMLIAGAGGGDSEQLEAVGTAAKTQLLSFQLQMYDLEDLFANPEQTEFLIVTIATELAARESMRLLNDLTYEAPDMPIKVKNVVVNQVLKDDGSDINTFLSHINDSQSTAVQRLEDGLSSDPNAITHVTKVPYLDTEPRGVYGLRILAEEFLKED